MGQNMAQPLTHTLTHMRKNSYETNGILQVTLAGFRSLFAVNAKITFFDYSGAVSETIPLGVDCVFTQGDETGQRLNTCWPDGLHGSIRAQLSQSVGNADDYNRCNKCNCCRNDPQREHIGICTHFTHEPCDYKHHAH